MFFMFLSLVFIPPSIHFSDAIPLITEHCGNELKIGYRKRSEYQIEATVTLHDIPWRRKKICLTYHMVSITSQNYALHVMFLQMKIMRMSIL